MSLNFPSLVSILNCVVPCTWPVLTFVLLAAAIGYFRSGMLYQGVVPSDGPAEFRGFASKQDRVNWWDTTPRRQRGILKTILYALPVLLVGEAVVWGGWFILRGLL
jgi:hypothetical protein